MKISTIRITIFLFLISFSKLASAQTPNPQDLVDNYVDGITKDLNEYMGNFMNPMLKGLGYGFNNGWYNTARPHKSLGFDLTFSVNAAYVPTVDQTFKFIPENYEVLDLYFDETDQEKYGDEFPTVMGDSTSYWITSYLQKGIVGSPTVSIGVLNGIQQQLRDNGIKSAAVPSPIIQLGVGIFKGTEIKVRWVPTIENSEDVEYKYFGLGVMHNVSQWVPVLKDLKFLDVSGFIGFTNVDVSYLLDKDPDFNPLGDQLASFGVNTVTYEVVGSATVSIITGFIGIGYDSFNSHLKMNGTYEFKIPGSDPTGNGNEIRARVENPVDLTAKDGGFRANIGARLKLAIFTLHASYSLQEYNTLNAGIGFSFR